MISDILIVGGGIFGATAGLSLLERGYIVTILDPGPLPHPLASSTDISKVVRMEYGSDESYMAMVEEALTGWHRWNTIFPEPLFHETGVVMLTMDTMAPGGFEYESYQMLLKRGHKPERLDKNEIRRRFPVWETGRYVDGFFHASAGYAESGRVVSELLRQIISKGGRIVQGGTVVSFVENNGQVHGVQTSSGSEYEAGIVLVAAGTWTHELIPELRPVMRSVGQPVFHLKPGNPELFSSPEFVVFTADVARTGWYGFPVHPGEGVVKVANHGAGTPVNPVSGERIVGTVDFQKLSLFLRETFPSLLPAKVVYSRLCLYCDTRDEHLWIDHHPERKGLVVAAGGSGHGFKFAPMLGDLIADVIENRPNPFKEKFRWRELSQDTIGEEAARHHG